MAEHLCLADDCEFTVEANPETVTEQLVETLCTGRQAGRGALRLGQLSDRQSVERRRTARLAI